MQDWARGENALERSARRCIQDSWKLGEERADDGFSSPSNNAEQNLAFLGVN